MQSLVWMLLLLLAYSIYHLTREKFPLVLRRIREWSTLHHWPELNILAYLHFLVRVQPLAKLWDLISQLIGTTFQAIQQPQRKEFKKQNFPTRRSTTNPIWVNR